MTHKQLIEQEMAYMDFVTSCFQRAICAARSDEATAESVLGFYAWGDMAEQRLNHATNQGAE